MDPQYFIDQYASDPDPWGFETRWYEARKYALTLACLPKPRYRRAFEPGCSFGVLSELLASRCDSLVCYELVPEVAARARTRLASSHHVSIHALAIPDAWPDAPLDLVVLSEVAYYLDAGGIDQVACALARTLGPGGHVVAVHYRGASNYPLSGDAAHAALAARLEGTATTVATWLEPAFRIEVFERGGT